MDIHLDSLCLFLKVKLCVSGTDPNFQHRKHKHEDQQLEKTVSNLNMLKIEADLKLTMGFFDKFSSNAMSFKPSFKSSYKSSTTTPS